MVRYKQTRIQQLSKSVAENTGKGFHTELQDNAEIIQNVVQVTYESSYTKRQTEQAEVLNKIQDKKVQSKSDNSS